MDKVKAFLKSRILTIVLLAAAVGYYVKHQKTPNLEEAIKDVMLVLVRVSALAETAGALVNKVKGTPTIDPSQPPPVPTPDKDNA